MGAKPGIVYFIQSRTSGHIKIGYTTDLAARFARMQAHSGDVLELRIHGAGTRQDERAMLDLFKSARVHGEWHKPIPELLAAIDHLRAELGPEKLRDYDCYKHALH